MESWRQIAYFIIGLFLGVIFHEYMHARMADWLGDHTARNAGRLTLNPIPHIDLFGTVLVPLVLIVLTRGHWVFAYAKPVPVNPFFFKKPKRDMMFVALFGPLTNFALAFIIALIGLIIRVSGVSTAGSWEQFFIFLQSAAMVNIVLGFFNLIPVPPLDGSHILEYALPARAHRVYQSIAPYGFVIIVGFLLIFGNFFFSWMDPIFRVLGKIIFGT